MTDIERMPVQLWSNYRPEYGAALKLALIRMDGRPDAVEPRQFLVFLQWMYDDYIFIPGAVAYASLALSPKRGRGMLKNLWSRDSSKALSGVRNATWDMALLRHWGRQVQMARESRQFPMLVRSDPLELRRQLCWSVHGSGQTAKCAQPPVEARMGRKTWGKADRSLSQHGRYIRK